MINTHVRLKFAITNSTKERERFFDLWIERPGDSIASIARELGIKSRNAQRWVKEYKKADNDELPVVKQRGKPPKLNDDHMEFLKNFVDDSPSSNLDDLMNGLSQSFYESQG